MFSAELGGFSEKVEGKETGSTIRFQSDSTSEQNASCRFIMGFPVDTEQNQKRAQQHNHAQKQKLKQEQEQQPVSHHPSTSESRRSAVDTETSVAIRNQSDTEIDATGKGS